VDLEDVAFQFYNTLIMIEKFFSCELMSDVVLNSRLATEGNMTTLDYIPGSNFLGIVASSIYASLTKTQQEDIFHNGQVSFGDALLYDGLSCSYRMPFSLQKNKLSDSRYWHHHLLNDNNYPLDEVGIRIQLQQVREGYINANGNFLPELKKVFSLKSAQDASLRKSKNGAMFGFESLAKGQIFVFSIRSKQQELLDLTTRELEGVKRLGKSKQAQFGQVLIKALEDSPSKIANRTNADYTLLYAQSNLCFFDDWGQPTFQPTPSMLGFPNARIDWSRSQIKTFSYSPWNGKRNCTNMQRDCISMGSVFYLTGDCDGTTNNVGAFQSEGLGRIILNPVFLFESNFTKSNQSTKQPINNDLSLHTKLARKLYAVKEKQEEILQAAKEVQRLGKEFEKQLGGISSSQWGVIRENATVESDFAKLETKLFGQQDTSSKGILKSGVAFDRCWSKRGRIETMQKLFNEFKNKESRYSTSIIAKFAAEMAKKAEKQSN
jgi:hypothetical protein